MSIAIDATSPAPPPVPAVSASGSTASGPATSGLANDPLANESTFLKLLVSQLQNQNPLNPTDANQFVGQLTAYSQLEQLIGIRQNTSTASSQGSAAGTPAGGTAPGAVAGQNSSTKGI